MQNEAFTSAVRIPVFGEAALFGSIALAIAGSFTGHTATLASATPAVRVLLIALSLAVGTGPAWVYYDVQRRDGDVAWVYATVLPVINLFGLVAYLGHRRRDDG